MIVTTFTRDDLVSGLRDLVAELRSAGEEAGIRLVGGAALALRYFERRTTNDLDSLHVQPGSDDAVAAAASRVGDRRGWDAGWFNFAVESADALPSVGRRAVEWETIYDSDGIVIQVASKEALLAMNFAPTAPAATWTTFVSSSSCVRSQRSVRRRHTTKTSIRGTG